MRGAKVKKKSSTNTTTSLNALSVVTNMQTWFTLKMILFINTVVYIKLCCRGEKKKISHT